jgi:hypothetical protein
MVLGGMKLVIKCDGNGEQLNINISGGSLTEKQYYYQLFMDMIGDIPFEVDIGKKLVDMPDIPVVITFTATNIPARVCKRFYRNMQRKVPGVLSEVVIDTSCY